MIFFVGLFWILQIYLFFIIMNIILSWVPALQDYSFFRICRRISDWYIRPFHGVIIIGPLDLTPIIGLILYEFVLGYYQTFVLILSYELDQILLG